MTVLLIDEGRGYQIPTPPGERDRASRRMHPPTNFIKGVTVEKLKCRKCGGELPPMAQDVGRPALYCSTGCRRAAEYELRRVQTAIEAAEKDARAHREHLALQPPYGMSCCGRGQQREHLTWLEREEVRLETRMKELCDD